MMKRLAGLVILLAVVAMSLNAQAKPGGVARMISMGGAVAGTNIALNPFVFNDPTWNLVNPAYASMYKDYIWSNIACANGYGNQFSGVTFGFGKEWAFGATLSYDPSATQALYRPGFLPAPYNNGLLSTFIGNVYAGRPANPAGASNALPPVEVFEVYTAYHMGTLDLGLAVMYGWASNDAKSTPSGAGTSEGLVSANVFGFRAGVILDLTNGSALEASAALRLDNAKDKITDPVAGSSEFNASGTEIQAAARLKLKMSNRVNFVPYAGIQSLSGEPKEDGVPTGRTATQATLKLSNFSLAVGAGAEYRTATFYLAGGLSFASLRTKAEATPPPPTGTTTSTVTSTNFPLFNLGAEWWFTDWLAGRLGYYRAFQNTNTKVEPPTGGTTTENAVFGGVSNVAIGGYNDDNLVTLGLGFKFGNFDLDATVSENALRSALGLIGSATNTFGYITMSYCFE
jgi:hypothetical protein